MIWPKHHSMLIEHNPHKSDMSIPDYLYSCNMLQDMDLNDFKECLRLDELWRCQFYPHTHISFRLILVPTWERLIEEINKLGENG